MHAPRTSQPEPHGFTTLATDPGSDEPSNAIVAQAMAAQVALPAPKRRNDTVRMIVLSLLALLAVGALALATGAISFTSPGSGPTDVAGGRDRDNTYSYYHDADYQTQRNGSKWTTDTTRTTDPDEAVLGNTSRWDYDGPYKYGPYGSDGMRKRTAGSTSTDPLYSDIPNIGDVFSASGDLDPSGGQPIGAPPSNYTNPYYDPYAGYTNPYANRIRLAYGEGYGLGSSSSVTPNG